MQDFLQKYIEYENLLDWLNKNKFHFYPHYNMKQDTDPNNLVIEAFWNINRKGTPDEFTTISISMTGEYTVSFFSQEPKTFKTKEQVSVNIRDYYFEMSFYR